MAIPSRILSAGNSPLATVSIAGDGAVGLVAVGSTASDPLQLSAVWNTLTTSSSGTGVKLPPTEAGAMVGIRNDSRQTIKVYPFNTSSTVNAGAASVDLATAKTMILFATSATTWASVTTA